MQSPCRGCHAVAILPEFSIFVMNPNDTLMANTYTQLYVQLVFAVKGRQHLIPKRRKEELHQYITGIVQKRGQKLLAVHCMPDHAHVFVGFGPTLTIADLVKDIKQATSVWIKEKDIAPVTFSWQEGYGHGPTLRFTYAQSQVKDVVQYVLNQEERHRVKTFQEEYLTFLERFEVAYDKRYVFEFYTPEPPNPSD